MSQEDNNGVVTFGAALTVALKTTSTARTVRYPELHGRAKKSSARPFRGVQTFQPTKPPSEDIDEATIVTQALAPAPPGHRRGRRAAHAVLVPFPASIWPLLWNATLRIRT